MTRPWVMVLAMGLLAESGCARDAPTFKSEKEKISYAIGMSLASQVEGRSIDVDPGAVYEGFRHALSHGPTRLSHQEVRGILVGLQKEVRAKQAALRTTNNGAATVPARIVVFFKMDPRLATGSYGGERWVSPPTYTRVGGETSCSMDARAQGLDVTGKTVKVHPTWTPSDPDMVTVTPGEGSQAQIVVQRPGESMLRVASESFYKDLTIKSVYRNNVLQVDISQN